MKKSSRGSVGNRYTWTRWSLAAVLAGALSLGVAPAAQADGTPDAAVTQIGPNDPVQTSQTLAQTVKAQHTGQLYQVDLHYGNLWFASSVTVQIWSVTSQGVPLSPVPSTLTAVPNVPFTANWHQYTLASRFPVQVNQTFAIVLSSRVAGDNRWSYNTAAGYTSGHMFTQARGTWGPYNLGSGAAFLFRTWVQTGPPTPTIAADRPGGASADEGTPPTMTGTYTNPTGGALKLVADHGQVTDLGSGKWSWTGDVYDEGTAPGTVSVTLTDSLNQTATTTFPLTIFGVKPTAGIRTSGIQAAAATSSTSVTNPEGTKLVLTGSASSADPADQAGVFTYSWTATLNGAALPPAGGASYPVATNEEGDTYVVTLRVTDDGGMVSDPVSITVVGAEVTPTPTITSITPADPTLTFVGPGSTLNFNGTYADPSLETHTFRWDFGDGGSATTLAASHAYGVGGTYNVTLTVTDDAGVAAAATTTVKVLTTQQALGAMVTYVEGIKTLNPGQQNSLIAKLNAASDASARGDNKAAGNQLNAFLNELEADLKTGKISATAYNALRADAHSLQGALGTYNRFLEWWPLPA